MKNLILLCLIVLLLSGQVFAANHAKIEPQCIQPEQSKNFEIVNETAKSAFSKIKTKIKTKKYPKYFHDFKTIDNDYTQNKAYKYVVYNDAELMYSVDTNELKYITFRQPEMKNCRIMYNYPSGELHAVQIFTSDNESFVYGPDGNYVDYAPYVKAVHAKVIKNWKVPKRKEIENSAKDQKDLLVQTALVLNKDGSVKKNIILKSSKIKLLDDNANAAIKSAMPFEPFPQNFFNDELIIILNFNFSL